MNTPALIDDCKLISEKLKQKWPQLTDQDLEYTEGAEEAIFAHIQKRTGAARHEIEVVIGAASAPCGCK